MVVRIRSQALGASAISGTIGFTSSLTVHRVHAEPFATPGLSSSGVTTPFLGISAFILTFAVFAEGGRISAKSLQAQCCLLSPFGKEPLAVFRLVLDPLTLALIAGPLLFANTPAVLRIGAETLSAPSLRRDLPLGLVSLVRKRRSIARLFETLYGSGSLSGGKSCHLRAELKG